MKKKIIFCLTIMISFQLMAQHTSIKLLTTDNRTSIRGLSVPDDKTAWVSGSAGTVARTNDGGITWQWMKVAGYEKRDFRDIEAFDSSTAIIMGVDWPAVILKTKDGGQNWYKVFEDTTKGMFLDAMDFDEKKGVVIGDPINNKLFMAVTDDWGEHWKIISKNEKSFIMKEGEAFFASSGTNVHLFLLKGQVHFIYVSGGTRSRLLSDKGINDSLPLVQGKESTGANSIAMNNRSRKGIIVGGDFAHDTVTGGNCVLFSPGGFTKPQTPPHGYRSCVIYINEKQLLTCGTSGIDISNDGGMNWDLVSKEGFHVCQKAKKGTAVYLAGGRGRIAKLILK